MIADLKPYEEYTESGVPWLGRVPANWSARRIKIVLRETDCRSSDGRGTLLSLTRLRGLIPHSNMTEKLPSARTLVGYKRYHAGQIVMNRMQAWSGMFGAGGVDGLVSPDYAVFDVLSGHETAFVLARLKSPDLVARFALESRGIGSGFNRLYTDRFGAISISLPPLVEQAAIMRFLDWVNGRLERTIRAKRKIIALLNEQKQAIIRCTVTRGLNPSVALRPSGVPWLGDIPQHWGVWRIGQFARVGNGSTPSRANPYYWHGGSYPWLNSAQVNRGIIDSADQFVTRRALGECHLPKVPRGSVLVAITGQGKTRGTAAILEIEATISQHVAFITPRIPVVSSSFIQVALTAAYRQLRALSDDSGSTKGAITCEDLKRFKIPIPPRGEQDELLERIHVETQAIGAMSSLLEREVVLLHEYRTRLVADVVTGKLDVREAAARLPEEALPATTEDDAVMIEETEAADEEVMV